jgi:DNA invertase Pin-like site-specific DNA recombinase
LPHLKTHSKTRGENAALLLGLAEIEYGNIRERQRAGIEAAKARGVYKGRPKALKIIKAAKARSLKRRGFSAQETAEALGVSRRTVLRYPKSN